MAVGIIAVLIGISVLAYKHVGAGGKAAGTDVAIKSLVAMMNEYKLAGNSSKARFDNNISFPTTTSPVPKYTNAQVAAPVDAVEAGQPGYSVDSASMSSDAVVRTRQVLKVLLTIPANKKMYADLPKELHGEETSDGPIIVDAYHAPIIYVPFKGLTGVTVVGSAGATVVSPEGVGFWASAGPDRIFATGDDNQYSWQK